MPKNHDRRRVLLAGLGAAGALALTRRNARADICGDIGPVAPLGPTMRNIYDKIAVTDQGLAEARIPINSLPSSATALHRIDSPGVYYMTGNLVVPAGSSAIEVNASNVEIEFDGFTIFGASGGTVPCIYTPSPQRCIGIYDAGFSGWFGNTIDLSNSSYCYLEECWFEGCNGLASAVGPYVCLLGSGGTIDDCNAMSCLGSIMAVGDLGTIEECVVVNGTDGCFFSSGRAVIEDNFALNTTGFGISVASGSVVIGNRIVATGGIEAGGASVISENDIDGGNVAISVTGSGANVEENHINNCPTAIDVTGSGHVIDGNQMSNVSLGISMQPSTSRCFVVRNVVRLNPGGNAYALTAGNTWGPIVNAEGIGDLSGSGTLTDPWSNFQY
jgi:hypothetical protein